MAERVVIAAFRSEAEAGMAQEALSGAGIAAEVRPRSEKLERLCADAFDDGLDVIVDVADAERGMEVLRAIWSDDVPIDVVRDPRCPECGSDDLVRLPRLRIFLVVAAILLPAGVLAGERDLFLLLIVIIGGLLLIAPNQRCRTCGERSRGSDPLPRREPVADESEEVICPRCGSSDTLRIARRRERALTLLVNFVIPPTLLVWPFLRRYRCSHCGHEWR